MKKFFKYLFVIVVLGAIGFFSYDYYMRNSGIENRIRYEVQKNDVKKDRPVGDFFKRLFD